MTKRSWKIPALLLAGALGGWLLSTFTAEARGDGERTEVLAEVGGARITRADVEQSAPDRFLNLARQRQDLTEQSLVQAVRYKLVEVEAAARGIPGPQLVEEEVFNRITPPTDEEIEAIWRRSGTTAPLDQVREDYRAALKIQAQEERYEEFLNELRAKHPVVTRLEPLREEVADRGFPSKGPEDAPITIVEFADFQCPYCRQLEGVLGQVLDAYGDEIRFVYRHYPLTNLHPGAQIAAEASMCAEEQGRFWDLHEAMFANPAAIAPSYLKQTARDLGMDGKAFDECLDAQRYKDRVDEDARAARALGLTGTPGLFVNGRFVAGVPEAESLGQLVVDEMRRVGQPIEPRELQPIRVAVEADGFPSKGPADAPVTIVEFADFQCPYCLRILPVLEDVLANYGDRIRFVYRQYPIAALHPEAQKAAEASLCAEEQGKFWEMHDAMFLNQAALGVSDLKETARYVGMDGGRFNACLDSGRYAEPIARDIEAGRRAGVSGTPSFFINGRFLDGIQSYETMAGIIEDELARAGR